VAASQAGIAGAARVARKDAWIADKRSDRDESLAAKEMDPSRGEKWLASLAIAARAIASKARIESLSAIFCAERAGFVSECKRTVNRNGRETAKTC